MGLASRFNSGQPSPYAHPTPPPQQQQQQQQQWGAPQQQQPQQQWGAPQQPGGSPYYGGSGQQYNQGPYGAAQYQPPQQQQQTPQQAPQQSGGGWEFGTILHTKLTAIIAANQLHSFYPPPVLQGVMQRLQTVDFRGLATRWGMPVELALDLASLALYDIVIFADDSTSMKYAERGDRIDDLKVILQKIAEVATLFDDDGISIRAINHPAQGDNIRTPAQAAQYCQTLKFSGMTPLATQLDAKVLGPFVYNRMRNNSLKKPVLVITITDGEPTQEPTDKIFTVIREVKEACAHSKYGIGSVAFQFAQVGRDQEAQKFLATLDNDPLIGRYIDATSYYELEAEEFKRKGVILTPELWLVKLMCGGIDETFDEQD